MPVSLLNQIELVSSGGVEETTIPALSGMSMFFQSPVVAS